MLNRTTLTICIAPYGPEGQDAPELKSEFLSSKSETNRNTQIRKSKSKTNLFGILCFFIIWIFFEFRISNLSIYLNLPCFAPWSISPGRDNPPRSSYYSTGLALWNTDSTKIELFTRSAIPRGEPRGISFAQKRYLFFHGIIPQGES